MSLTTGENVEPEPAAVALDAPMNPRANFLGTAEVAGCIETAVRLRELAAAPGAPINPRANFWGLATP